MNNKKDILDWYQKNSKFFPFWFILYGSEKGNLVDSSPNIENYSEAEGYQDLSHALSRLLPKSKYVIRLKAAFDSNNSSHFRTTDYHVPEQMVQVNQVAGIGSVDVSDIEARAEKMAQERFDAFVKAEENKKLLARIEELERTIKNPPKEERQSAVDGVIEKFMPKILDMYFDGEAEPKAKIGNLPKKEVNVENIQENIEDWAELDAEVGTVIAKIVNLAKTNPSKYKMAKSMLK